MREGQMRLLLGSGGMSTDERRARWKRAFDAFLGETQALVFVPYAADRTKQDRYAAWIREMHPDREIRSVHEADDPRALVAEADALYMGGGNSFLLLQTLQKQRLLEPVRRRVLSGMPYVGVSAGTNMACPTMRTTNDMPIVTPENLDALGLIPFQINPHYFSGPSFLQAGDGYLQYGGETRDDRLREYHEQNPLPVLGLWEGGWLRVENGTATIEGAPARLLLRGAEAVDLPPGTSVAHLFQAG